MDRIKQLTTAALSEADSLDSTKFYDIIELLAAAINELADAITDDEPYLDEIDANWGRAEITE